MSVIFFFFFFNDTATTEIYTLSLHDALPICFRSPSAAIRTRQRVRQVSVRTLFGDHTWHPSQGEKKRWRTNRHSPHPVRSEEHTSELQSQSNIVCRLLLEKKKKKT